MRGEQGLRIDIYLTEVRQGLRNTTLICDNLVSESVNYDTLGFLNEQIRQGKRD